MKAVCNLRTSRNTYKPDGSIKQNWLVTPGQPYGEVVKETPETLTVALPAGGTLTLPVKFWTVIN